MIKQDISKFYKEITDDKNLSVVLIGQIKRIENPEELLKFIEEKIIPQAKKMGYNISLGDLLNYEREHFGKLSEEELEDVSGGVSLRAFTAGSMAALSMFGSLGLDKASAMVSNTAVINQTNSVMSGLGLQDGEMGEAQENMTESEKAKDSDIKEKVVKAQDKLKEEVSKLQNDDKRLYFLEALNTIEPYIFLQSSFLSNLRFYGNLDKLGVEKLEDGSFRRSYKDDEASGITGLVRFLFPSRTGSLSSEACEIGKNLMQDIIPTVISCIYENRINPKLELSPNEEIEKLIADFRSPDFFKVEKIYEKDGNKEKQSVNANVTEKKEICKKRINQTIESLQEKNSNNSFINLLESLRDQVQSLTPKNFSKIDNIIKILDKTLVLLRRVKEALIEEKNNKDVPSYTTERVLMSFVLDTCNDNELNDIIFKIANSLSKCVEGKDSIITKGLIKNNYWNLDYLKDLINSPKTEFSPYKLQTLEHSKTLCTGKVYFDGDKKVVTFFNSTFADCADITARHFLNLITYSQNKDWSFFQIPDEGSEERKILDQKLEQVKKAIAERSSVEFFSLKDRVQMFMLHQQKHLDGADAVDLETRSLWEYVVCNMNEDGGDYYKLEYNNEKDNNCFELTSSFDNMLKLMYNIAKAFSVDESSLKDAKSKIDKMYGPNNRVEAVEATIALFNNKKFKVENFSVDEISCSCEDLTFRVKHIYEHSKLNHIPMVFAENVSEDDYKYTDDFEKMFLGVNRGIYFENKFYGIYCMDLQENINPQIVTFGDLMDGKYKRILELFDKKTFIDSFNHILAGNARYDDYFIISQNIDMFKESLSVLENKHEKNLIDVVIDLEINNFIKEKNDLMKNEIGNFVMHELLKTETNLVLKGFVKNNKNIYWESEDKKEVIVFAAENLESLNNIAKGAEKLTIGSDIFLDDKGIEEFNLTPCENLLEINISSYALRNFHDLKNVVFPKRLQRLNLGTDVFYNNKIEKFDLSNCSDLEVLTIGNGAFNSCNKMQQIMLPPDLKVLRIEGNAFSRYDETKIELDLTEYTNLEEVKIETGSLNVSLPKSLEKQNIQT